MQNQANNSEVDNEAIQVNKTENAEKNENTENLLNAEDVGKKNMTNEEIISDMNDKSKYIDDSLDMIKDKFKHFDNDPRFTKIKKKFEKLQKLKDDAIKRATPQEAKFIIDNAGSIHRMILQKIYKK